VAAGGDAEFAGELAAIFIEEVASKLANLRAATETNDQSTLQAVAHSLKGAASTLGFEEVARRALALEMEARARTLDATIAAHHLELLTRACAEAQRHAREFLGGSE